MSCRTIGRPRSRSRGRPRSGRWWQPPPDSAADPPLRPGRRLSTTGLPPARRPRSELGIAAARRDARGRSWRGGGEGAGPDRGRWLRLTGAHLFNGPAAGHAATVVAHAQPLFRPRRIYVVESPIERIRGDTATQRRSRSRILNRTGVSRTRVEVARRYRRKGEKRSYVSAHARTAPSASTASSTFANDITIDGSVGGTLVPAGGGGRLGGGGGDPWFTSSGPVSPPRPREWSGYPPLLQEPPRAAATTTAVAGAHAVEVDRLLLVVSA